MDWLFSRLVAWTSRREDVASLVVVRVLVGAFNASAALWLLSSDWLVHYVAQTNRYEFHWYGLEWFGLPRDLWVMRGLLAALALASLGTCLGLFYRPCTAIAAGLLAYGMAADQHAYSSTYYLLILVTALLAVAPANRDWSIDARRRSGFRAGHAVAWPAGLLRFQIGVVYLYAAVCKVNADWLMGRAVSVWLRSKTDMPVVGPMLAHPWTPYALSWAGLVFDGLIVPLLLWRRTRTWAFATLVVFHTFNGIVLDVFPLPVLAGTLSVLFFSPSWPRRLIRTTSPIVAVPPHEPSASPCVLAFVVIWISWQVALPLQQFLVPGDVAWHGQLERFCWRLRARSKRVSLRLEAYDPGTQQRWRLLLDEHLTARQQFFVRFNADHLLQFAHQLASEFAAEGRPGVQLYATVRQSVNGGPWRLVVDRHTDLTTAQRGLGVQSWMIPTAQRGAWR